MNWSQQEIEQALEQIRMRSSTDPEYRALAISDGAAALAEINPKPLPAGYQVRFLDNSHRKKAFILPDPINAVEELTDDELEAVAGGSRNNIIPL